MRLKSFFVGLLAALLVACQSGQQPAVYQLDTETVIKLPSVMVENAYSSQQLLTFYPPNQAPQKLLTLLSLKP